MKAVITVVGKDTVGVIAKVSGVCAQLNINVQDVTQSIMQDMFCMIMLVDLSRCSIDIASVRSQLDAVAAEMGMELHLTREEVFDAMHHI
ncbi:ACT domain-containing protein [uncultured Allofournierella sp.]|jgi:ACT domain-containing protein|uniref:ACT domain-containing protein n=1 Tax=uncultured Allofournierella sp. TaxID=1940258 RepID=UPI0037513378